MKLQTMIEMIQQPFPEKMEGQIKADLNTALKAFSEDTRLPFGAADITQNDEGLTDGQTTLGDLRGWYAIPDAREIVGVTAYDAQGNTVDRPEYIISYRGKEFIITDVRNDSTVMGNRLPAGIACLRFRFTMKPVELRANTDEPDLPEQFHQALVDHVFAKYYALKGILQQSGWFRSSYQAQVAAGKRYFNRNI